MYKIKKIILKNQIQTNFFKKKTQFKKHLQSS